MDWTAAAVILCVATYGSYRIGFAWRSCVAYLATLLALRAILPTIVSEEITTWFLIAVIVGLLVALGRTLVERLQVVLRHRRKPRQVALASMPAAERRLTGRMPSGQRSELRYDPLHQPIGRKVNIRV